MKTIGANTIYRFEMTTWEGAPCREVEADGPPEAFFGEDCTILNIQELPDGRWIARYVPPEGIPPSEGIYIVRLGAGLWHYCSPECAGMGDAFRTRVRDRASFLSVEVITDVAQWLRENAPRAKCDT